MQFCISVNYDLLKFIVFDTGRRVIIIIRYNKIDIQGGINGKVDPDTKRNH